MLSQLRNFSSLNAHINPAHAIEKSACEDRWNRNMQEDMKEAIDLLFKFKASLDKLHPECLAIIERMISLPPRNY